MNTKILTLNNIAPAGLRVLPRDRYEVGSEIALPDAIILRSHKMHDMEIPTTLEAVGRAGAGVNNIPVDSLSSLGIPVFNAPGANANAVKELVLAGLLLSARNICRAWDFVREIEVSADGFEGQVEAGKKLFVGSELPGKTLAVVGLGAIGVEVANAALELGMKVVGHDPHITVEGAWKLSSEVEAVATLDELYAMADYITFHVPLIDATRGLLGAQRMAAVKSGAVVLNFARNGVVDDAAVIEALNEGALGGYVTDFPSQELREHEKVICLPHLGASTAEAEENCAVMVVRQVKEYLETGNIVNSVNFPQAKLATAGSHRLCVANRNAPDMIGQISHAVGKAEVNIVHMRNESRGELAYNLIDVEGKIGPTLLREVSAISGVLKVRALAWR